MRFFFLLPPALLLAAAGCNASGRRQERAGVRPRDPAFEAGLKTLQEHRGFKHKVRRGETLYALKRRYGVPLAAILAANPGLDPKDMKVGSEVIIPGAAPAGARRRPAATGPRPPKVRTPDRGRLRSPARSRYRLVKRPTPGLEFSAKAGDTVVAAARGKVVVATADLGGLGPTVMLDHGKGLVTLYGRLADYAVRAGQRVRRGEPLGRCGAAGLLFRVYRGAAPKNPAPYVK